MDWMKIVGRNIRTMRRSMGYTQAKLAELLDLSDGYINKLERGVANLTIPNLFKLSAILKMPVEKLLEGAVPSLPDSVESSGLSEREILANEIQAMMAGCSEEYVLLIHNLVKAIINIDGNVFQKRRR